jgi:hypothetical protein
MLTNEGSDVVAIPAFIARYFGPEAYARQIGKGLSDAYRDAARRPIELADLRAVVFSDHHRGRGDGADDFRRCEAAYCAALGWYLEAGYELWLLGDVEELWENGPRQVLEHYDDVLELESKFGARVQRFYGNHDMAWRSPRFVTKWLGERAPATGVQEAVRVVLTEEGKELGTLFLVHGHQGTLDSGNLLVVPFSRFAVRVFWGTLQRLFGFASTSPATDNDLRSKHDSAMAAWADAHPERLVMVAGHTHHPVFAGTKPPDLAADATARRTEYDEAVRTGVDVVAARAALELALAREIRDDHHRPVNLKRFSYFNTGCCSFGDGDVTGLEFAEGEVKLVRWLDDDGRAIPHQLEEPLDLKTILANVTGDAPTPAVA